MKQEKEAWVRTGPWAWPRFKKLNLFGLKKCETKEEEEKKKRDSEFCEVDGEEDDDGGSYGASQGSVQEGKILRIQLLSFLVAFPCKTVQVIFLLTHKQEVFPTMNFPLLDLTYTHTYYN